MSPSTKYSLFWYWFFSCFEEIDYKAQSEGRRKSWAEDDFLEWVDLYNGEAVEMSSDCPLFLVFRKNLVPALMPGQSICIFYVQHSCTLRTKNQTVSAKLKWLNFRKLYSIILICVEVVDMCSHLWKHLFPTFREWQEPLHNPCWNVVLLAITTWQCHYS